MHVKFVANHNVNFVVVCDHGECAGGATNKALQSRFCVVWIVVSEVFMG